jgi:hypothetical protein
MARREWKPGDVALVQNEHGVWNTAICQLTPPNGECRWVYGVAFTSVPPTAEARPLVVVDPDDRDQVERLVSAYAAHYPKVVTGLPFGTDPSPWFVESMQTVLREFANPTPPKPEEPTGLGAVVEDSEGRLWTRVADATGKLYWMRTEVTETSASSVWTSWAGTHAVKVLSEGVTR